MDVKEILNLFHEGNLIRYMAPSSFFLHVFENWKSLKRVNVPVRRLGGQLAVYTIN